MSPQCGCMQCCLSPLRVIIIKFLSSFFCCFGREYATFSGLQMKWHGHMIFATRVSARAHTHAHTHTSHAQASSRRFSRGPSFSLLLPTSSPWRTHGHTARQNEGLCYRSAISFCQFAQTAWSSWSLKRLGVLPGASTAIFVWNPCAVRSHKALAHGHAV